ncbi:Fibroblast growth factor-binding protein 1 [Collichthys lucidus]|uniref:Fibroblast growth factor-binding protein 1 n=1 Tax=Collichthys lucidus TaxID=240159 RepID=A0A4U5UDG0_COLLU|nr:Fibroblast growth factor-binding protein 1 [Collichthys lucidus]
MWSQASTLPILLACCLWSTEAQSNGSRRQSIWDDPIKFKTKENDLCTMTVTGQGEYTRLRLSCQGSERSYWCEYVGKPYTCRSYNKNPRHYFLQMMWGLRKINNACQAPRQLKSHMCRNGPDDSHMVFSSGFFSRSRPDARPRPQPRPTPTRQALTRSSQVPPRVKTTQGTSTQPTTPPVESNPRRIARQYCWRVCCAGFMAFLTNITILLVMACFYHQLMLSSCQKSHGRRGRGVERGQHKDRSGLKVSRQPKSVSGQPIKGKVVTKDKSECTWAATGEDLFILGVTCKKGDRSFSCEYVARPSVCPQYVSNVKLYWKQMARALKKQKNLCQDSNALVKAGMCRRAARAAHFRLRTEQRKTDLPSTPRPEPRAVKSCQAENKKLAEEYCNDSWSSVCTFLFTMVQDYDC